MVLQRSPAASRIWGRAVPGDVVAVKIGVPGGVAVAVGNGTAEAGTGNWAVRLPPIAAGGPYSVVIRSTRPTDPIITLTDVLVGEVHVCSGQSNMDFTLAGVFNASAECAAAEYPSLRLFKPQRLASAFPLFDLSGSAVLNWTHATPNTTCGAAWQTTLDRSTGFSAACYFYAQELHQSLGGIPIGVIDTAWGGSTYALTISAVCALGVLAWTSRWV
jgi:sialate O-acetylesterase